MGRYHLAMGDVVTTGVKRHWERQSTGYHWTTSLWGEKTILSFILESQSSSIVCSYSRSHIELLPSPCLSLPLPSTLVTLYSYITLSSPSNPTSNLPHSSPSTHTSLYPHCLTHHLTSHPENLRITNLSPRPNPSKLQRQPRKLLLHPLRLRHKDKGMRSLAMHQRDGSPRHRCLGRWLLR
jgi:hypothetical protein